MTLEWKPTLFPELNAFCIWQLCLLSGLQPYRELHCYSKLSLIALLLTSTFSSRRWTFRANCSRVPTSGYFVSWKRFSKASSCSSVKMVRCLLLRRQWSWFRSWSSVRDSVPTFIYDIIWWGTGEISTDPVLSKPVESIIDNMLVWHSHKFAANITASSAERTKHHNNLGLFSNMRNSNKRRF